jgi:hypothetical protein
MIAKAKLVVRRTSADEDDGKHLVLCRIERHRRASEQAGFFEHGKNRLVMPAIVGAPEPEGGKDKDENEQDFKNKNGNRGGGPPGDHELDPLLIALLKKILDPEKGWPGPSRVRLVPHLWMNVSQIYDGDEEPL